MSVNYSQIEGIICPKCQVKNDCVISNGDGTFKCPSCGHIDSSWYDMENPEARKKRIIEIESRAERFDSSGEFCKQLIEDIDFCANFLGLSERESEALLLMFYYELNMKQKTGEVFRETK